MDSKTIRRPGDLKSTDFPIPHRKLGELPEVEPLLVLCAEGKLYEIETWISKGHPLQFPPPVDRKSQRISTALQIAVEKRFHSLAALLLANGYDPNGDYYECLSSAVTAKDHDLVDLLLRFGADPHAIDFCTVLETCDRWLMDRFVAAGVDPCNRNAVARALHFKGRPILGFIKQYRDQFPQLQNQIDIALHVFTEQASVRGVALMLWLGANPHAPTPSSAEAGECVQAYELETAFETALWSSKPEILDPFLKYPIPLERVDHLLHRAHYNKPRPDLVERLLAMGANPNSESEEGYPVLHGYLTTVLSRFGRPSPEEREQGFLALECLLKAGSKLKMTDQQLKHFRRRLLDGFSEIVVRTLALLRKYEAVTPEQFHELTRTQGMKRVLNGFTKPYNDPLAHYYQYVPPSPPPQPAPARGYWKRHWSQR